MGNNGQLVLVPKRDFDNLSKIVERLDALTEQVRIANFFTACRYFNDSELEKTSEEIEKICKTSGEFWSPPEVAKRFRDCVKSAIAN